MTVISGDFVMYQDKFYSGNVYLKKSTWGENIEFVEMFLRSNDNEDIEKGFIEDNPNEISRYRKKMTTLDIDNLFFRKTTAIYNGDRFDISVIHDNQTTMCTDSRELYEKYNLKMWDRDYFFMEINLKEIPTFIQVWNPIDLRNFNVRKTKKGSNVVKMQGKFAFMNDREYEVQVIEDDKLLLISSSRTDLDYGFAKVDEKRYEKIVSPKEVGYVFDRETIVKYRNVEHIAPVIVGNEIKITTKDQELGVKRRMKIDENGEYYMFINLMDVQLLTQTWARDDEHN